MAFIPELRAALAKQVPVDDKEAVIGIIQRWEIGQEAVTPLEHGVFAMCAKVAEDLRQREAEEPEDSQP